MCRFLKTMEEPKPSSFLVIVMLACLFSFSTQDCARPTDLQDNVVISPNQTSYMTWYSYVASCKAWYNVAGPTTLFCSLDYDGKPDYWNPDPSLTTCNAAFPCSRPNVDPDVIITPDKSTYDTYENINFTCSVEGYTIAGPEHAHCGDDGAWNPSNMPPCVEGCTAPANTNVTGSFKHGDIVVYSCNSGFKLADGSPAKQTQCNGGEWIPVNQCEEIEVDMEGVWYNECNDQITISLTSTGMILGDYMNSAELLTGMSAPTVLVGYCNFPTFGFVVSRDNGKSTTSWSGQSKFCGGEEVLYTTWTNTNRVTTCSDIKHATLIGQEKWTRYQQSQAPAPIP